MPTGHHSFHEVIGGAPLALGGVPGHDPALDYQGNWPVPARPSPLPSTSCVTTSPGTGSSPTSTPGPRSTPDDRAGGPALEPLPATAPG